LAWPPTRNHHAACQSLDRFAEKFAALTEADRVAEVARARGQLLLSLHRACEDPEGLGHFVGEGLITQSAQGDGLPGGAWDPAQPFRRIESIRKITPDQVLQVARKYLVPSARTRILLTAPKSERDSELS
jgi:hypothetical protein